MAIWIEDIDRNFIMTRLLQADRRKEWLITWNNKSDGSTLDAITGATLGSHQTHTIDWEGSILGFKKFLLIVLNPKKNTGTTKRCTNPQLVLSVKIF